MNSLHLFAVCGRPGCVPQEMIRTIRYFCLSTLASDPLGNAGM